MQIAAGVLFAARFPAGAAAQSTSAAAPSGQPGGNRDNEFHSPLPAPLLENREAFRSQYLLGDWMGARSALAGRGIRFDMLFISDPFGNVSGGLRRGATVYNLAGFGVVLRTDRLLGWRGGQFHVGFAVNFGTSLSKNYVGNSFPVQLADVADAHPRLTYLSYTQSLFEDRVSVRVGRVTINSVADEEFLGSQYFKVHLSWYRLSAARHLLQRARRFRLPGYHLGRADQIRTREALLYDGRRL
jgi:hypothetical protein